jgi:hypothetical protein
MQHSPPDNEWSSGILLAATDISAHQIQGLNDAIHRPGSQRGITGDYGEKWLCRKQSRQETHGGAAIAGVEYVFWPAEALTGYTIDESFVPIKLNLHAQSLQTREGRKTISREQKIGNLSPA